MEDRAEISHKKQPDKQLAIHVDGLTKVYPLYASPDDRLKEALHPLRKKYHQSFYALKNVSFQVEKGDSLGIIGQNGSGKSTLLKVLSRVLTPTSGSFHISGRLISLLELGSGFNTELTGLENIYFYGTILGFSKQKIESRMDDIIAFADIGQFIGQPLKTYSSGMRSRLAFSVASHVDPDILILDEVLAVGDLRFKQKCFRVMHDIIDQKRTVILVTHDTGSVINFCNKALWLDAGQIKDFGDPADLVKSYVGFMTYGLETTRKQPATSEKSLDPEKPGASASQKEVITKIGQIRWSSTTGLDSFGEFGAMIDKLALYERDSGKRVDILRGGEWLSLYTRVKAKQTLHKPGIGLRFKDKRGNGVFTVNNYLYDQSLRPFEPGETIVIRTDFKLPLLINGKYAVTVALSDGNQSKHIQHHWIHDALLLRIENQTPPSKRTGNMVAIDQKHYAIEIMEHNG